ncbi:MAG: hypothetical protein SF052_14035 [Bacteroidia bacterium]|nr:hypothetical protein [Bacteroidia bacterium]
MLTERSNLPFSIEDVYAGFAKVSGILSVVRDHVILEFQVSDAIGGIVKGKPKEIRIPLRSIESVQFKKNWFAANFYLRVYRMKDLEAIPTNRAGEVKLSIQRKHRERALQLASSMNLRLSELRIEMMDEEFPEDSSEN